LLATLTGALVLAPASAQAQVQVTPNFSITPSSSVTKWIMWMALGAIILALLILVAVGVSYLRFAPKFYARQESPKLPPGARPPLLTRTVRPQPAVGAARPAAQMAGARTVTAVAERPAPEPRPTTQTADEVGAQPEETVGQAPTTSEQAEAAVPKAAAAEQAEAAPQAAAPAPTQPAAHGAAAALDQETFDRVLEEQLGKGVDRRVAEGRARAAAVVAARKKA
jgi:hypothetical protein